MPSSDAWLGAAVTFGLAGLTGLGWLAKRALQTEIATIAKTVTKELNHNGGSSLKDMARDSRDGAVAAAAEVERVAHAQEETRAMLTALHLRYDRDRETDAFRDGQKAEALRKLQHDVTATRTGLALHVYESEQARAVFLDHGIDLPPMTHPAGSPLAPQPDDPRRPA